MIVQITHGRREEDNTLKLSVEEIECDSFYTYNNWKKNDNATGTLIRLYKDDKPIGDYGLFQLHGVKSEPNQ